MTNGHGWLKLCSNFCSSPTIIWLQLLSTMMPFFGWCIDQQPMTAWAVFCSGKSWEQIYAVTKYKITGVKITSCQMRSSDTITKPSVSGSPELCLHPPTVGGETSWCCPFCLYVCLDITNRFCTSSKLLAGFKSNSTWVST